MTSPEQPRRRNWVCILNRSFAGREASRKAAMNLADKPYRSGGALVRNERSGKQWARRGGSWYKLDPDPDERLAA